MKHKTLSYRMGIGLVLIVIVLAGCGAPAAPTQMPTAAPVSTAAIAPTTPAAAAGSTATNDATQARLRVNNCVFKGPVLDVWLNGQAGMNGGVPMPKLPPLASGGYVYLQPGTVQVAVTPAGGSLDSPFAGPLDVPVSAGHRYTVVVMGQAAESSHSLLLIDETAAYQSLGVSTSQSRLDITVNNLKGAAWITVSQGGIVRENQVPYGGYQAAVWPVGEFTGFEITASGQPQPLDSSSDPDWHGMGVDSMQCFGGTLPGTGGTDFDYVGSALNTDLSPIDYMKMFGVVARQQRSFDIFLKAIQTAGLTEQLNTGGPYLVFAPSDSGFGDAVNLKLLPQTKLDAIQNDPKAAAEFVKGYVAQGFYPLGSLSGGLVTGVRTIQNLLGQDLKIEGEAVVFLDSSSLQINGSDVGAGLDAMTANGTRVHELTHLLP